MENTELIEKRTAAYDGYKTILDLAKTEKREVSVEE